jgi:hypothetical protein
MLRNGRPYEEQHDPTTLAASQTGLRIKEHRHNQLAAAYDRLAALPRPIG